MAAVMPETHYAKAPDGVHIGYQVVGAGSLDLIFANSWCSHIEFSWSRPAILRFYEHLSSFCRLILFDKRGTGLSDPVPGVPTMEDRLGDIRPVLPTVRVPTLVLHRTDELWINVNYGRYTAAHIPGATLVELPGTDHYPWEQNADEVVGQVEEFLTGARRERDDDRVLATVLFTDIVQSTEQASEVGDRRWRELLDAHDHMVRRQLERFSGNEVKSTGDGFLATFDGPARGIRCAMAISDGARRLGIGVRAGLHTGELERRGEDVGGIAVHIGSRVAGRAQADEVLVSSTVKDLVAGSRIEFADRGEHALRGVPDTWHLFAAVA